MIPILYFFFYLPIGIGRSPDTNVKKINLKHALDLDRRGLLHRQYNLPPSKDTIAVPNNGYVVLRFRADNPGKNIITTYTYTVEYWSTRTKEFYFILYYQMIYIFNMFLICIRIFLIGSWLFHCHFLYHIGQ